MGVCVCVCTYKYVWVRVGAYGIRGIGIRRLQRDIGIKYLQRRRKNKVLIKTAWEFY